MCSSLSTFEAGSTYSTCYRAMSLCCFLLAGDATLPAADWVERPRFHSWHPTTLLPYLGSCLLLVAFAVLHEALASWRVSFAKNNTPAAPHGYVAVAGSERFKEKSLLQLRVTNSLLYTANITTGGSLCHLVAFGWLPVMEMWLQFWAGSSCAHSSCHIRY
jgi:hypothetical protein